MLKKGFTLIELIFVIVILSIIAAIGSRVMGSAFNSYKDNQGIVSADEQGRLALEKMIRDIHGINSNTSITTFTASALTFTNVSGASVAYTLSGTNLQRNGVTLASGVNSLTFGYYGTTGAVTAVASSIAYIDVTLNITQNGVNYTLPTTIMTMNYI